jgi:hypothetical protein
MKSSWIGSIPYDHAGGKSGLAIKTPLPRKERGFLLQMTRFNQISHICKGGGFVRNGEGSRGNGYELLISKGEQT